jgi:hypothetical protein
MKVCIVWVPTPMSSTNKKEPFALITMRQGAQPVAIGTLTWVSPPWFVSIAKGVHVRILARCGRLARKRCGLGDAGRGFKEAAEQGRYEQLHRRPAILGDGHGYDGQADMGKISSTSDCERRVAVTVNSPLARSLLLLLSMLLYVTSLFFEAIPGVRGITVLLMGWMEFVTISTVGPFVALAWFANPLFLLVLALDSFPIRLFRYAAKVLAIIAVVLSVGYIFFGTSIVTDESGALSTRVALTVGYVLWLGSILAALIRAFLPEAE